jgi:EAL domain-containing protein (putative c-di-GMP-specific phosphodiesterase class I)
MPAILENIQKCFTRSFNLRGLSILIDASIGGVVLRNPNDTTADILSQSEEAMRKAKLGKVAGIALVDEGMIKELKSRSSLDKEIHEAVRTKSLFLLFQPIVFLETGKIVGAEGLMRFRRKDGSILNAAEFMDALIRTGSLSLIDEMVIANFLDSEQIVIRSILKKGDFRFSFNISPGILANVGYAEGILKQIQKRNFSPDRFTLEILEEGLMPTNGTVRQNLITLRDAGVRISVDDFGIGYSNLVRLSRLPLGELKIPRELLAGIKSGDQRLRSLLDAVLGIAKNLNLSVIAEGIEEQDEVEYLRKLGCKYGQGYLFGKGMPLEELAARVEKQV